MLRRKKSDSSRECRRWPTARYGADVTEAKGCVDALQRRQAWQLIQKSRQLLVAVGLVLAASALEEEGAWGGPLRAAENEEQQVTGKCQST